MNAKNSEDAINEIMREPIAAEVTGMTPFRLPMLRFRSKEGDVAIIQQLWTHPDTGTIFDASLLFKNKDGSMRHETWRGTRNMLGEFFISEAVR